MVTIDRSMVNDPARLAAVLATGVIDRPAVLALDELARLTAKAGGVPVAAVSLVQEHTQFLAGAVGLAEPLASTRENPNSHSFCVHVVETAEMFEIEDARTDIRVMDNPAVEQLGVISYLGAPLTSAEGHVLGSLCMVDGQPRTWTDDDRDTLRSFAVIASKILSTSAAESAASHSERRLAEFRSRLELSYEHAPIGIAMVALDGTWVEVNPALCELLGYEEDELRKLRLQDVTHPEDLAADLVLIGRLMDGEIPKYAIDKRYRRRDGSSVWATLHVSLIRDEHGTPLYMIAQIKDVSDRREREMALAEAHRHLSKAAARWRAAFEDAPVAMAELDGEGRILASNPAYQELVGRTEAELTGQSARMVVHPEDVDASQSGFDRLAQGEVHTLRSERRVLRPDGSVVWVTIQAARMRPDDDEPEIVLVHLFDGRTQPSDSRPLPV